MLLERGPKEHPLEVVLFSELMLWERGPEASFVGRLSFSWTVDI